MQVLTNDKTVFTDIDDTLIIWPHTARAKKLDPTKAHELSLDVHSKIMVHVNDEMIEFLGNLKAQGVTIIAWSHAGPKWAEYVLNYLQLDKVVDLVVSKPYMMLDDKPVEHLGNTTWFGPKG